MTHQHPALADLNFRPLHLRFRVPAVRAERRMFATGELLLPNGEPAPAVPMRLRLEHFIRTECDGWTLHGFRIGPKEELLCEGALRMMMLEDPGQSSASLGVAAPGQPVVACVSHCNPAFRALEVFVRAVGTVCRADL